MKSIFVVCGAGASSTFLAHWMRTVASQRSEQITVTPSSLAEVHARFTDGDVVLVGHHLESHFEALASAAHDAGAAAALLPPLNFDAAGAAVALAVAHSVAPGTEPQPEPEPEPEPHHREPENIHG